jgi:hypothetical protein
VLQPVPVGEATVQRNLVHVATVSQLCTGLVPYSHSRPFDVHAESAAGCAEWHTGAGPPSLQLTHPPLLLLVVPLLVPPLALPAPLLVPLLPLLAVPLLPLLPPLLPPPLVVPLPLPEAPDPLPPPDPVPLLLAVPPSPPPPSPLMAENEAPPHATARPPSHPKDPTARATLMLSG